mgnify:CR=1 FL=1
MTPTSRLRFGPVLALMAVLAVSAPATPTAHAQVVRGYVPADELVSFPASTPISQFLRLVNPTFQRVTGKSVVDPQDRSDAIGVALNGVHFIDAFELVLDRHGLDFSESSGYFIVTEPEIVATTTDGASNAAIGAAAAASSASAVAALPATADTREIRVDAVIFQLNSTRAREVGTNWSALFDQAQESTSGTQFFVNAGSFFDALDGFLEASSDRVDLTTILNLFRYFEERGYGQTIATPFTVVQSGSAGRMQSGQDFPVTVRDFQGNAITQFFSTGTIIDVTPTLLVDERGDTPVEFIHLEVKVEKSTGVPSTNGVSISKDDIQTELPVLSGEMRAIGGLTSTDESTTRKGVPILRSIPILKYLFSYEQTTVQQNEIIVVLRARVADDLRTRMLQGYPRTMDEVYDQEQTDAQQRMQGLGVGPGTRFDDRFETERGLPTGDN